MPPDSTVATGTGLRTATERVPIRVRGKFFFAGEEKFFVKGATYGPFGLGSHGSQFPEREVVARDFALMVETGVNTLRVFTVPPLWLLDLADDHGLKVLVGIPWSQHVTFLDDPAIAREVERTVVETVKSMNRHPAIFAYLVGNEIPPDMVRWHGPERVRAFLKRLVVLIKEFDADRLVSYANFPSTEYLTIDFTDFLCFNVYLHQEGAFRRYVSRLHNLAVDRPLVLTEFGIDSMREGTEEQARILSWQLRTAFEMGVAGAFVFAWTDEWFTGGHLIEDWAFGLVDRDRQPKPAFAAVQARYQGAIPPPLPRTPRVSVVVCTYNAERTLAPCLESLAKLNYPDYEVIVVNDGSTDGSLAIAERFGYCRIISQPNKGLSVARNVGAQNATGEIIAYTDSDCVADPDWLAYLIAKMEVSDLAACGGPNFPPPEDSLVPAAVAVSPGGPTHVLLSDDVAEHIAGCNMAFRRDALLRLGGFDPIYRAAGDDVDICWRFQDAGYTIGFSPAAVVWHFRRNTVKAYIGQQRGYGKAEALVYSKHPIRFNLFGQAKWLGRIYGDLSAALLLSRRPVIYSGVFGRGLFQTLYEPPSSLAQFLPLTFEWNVVAIVLALVGLVAGGWMLLFLVPLVVTWVLCINGALRAPIDKRFRGVKARALVALLIYLGPIVRGWERLKWRWRDLKTADSTGGLDPTMQEPRIDWRERAFYLSYWSEKSDEKEALLGELMRFLAPQKYFIQVDQGWNDWDLKIARGLWSRAYLLVCTENHGGEKRLLRVRSAMRLSRFSTFVLRAYAIATAAALILDAPAWAAIVGILGIAQGALIAYRTVEFGQLMQRIVETVAKRQNLTPVAPS
ncbi:MAG TPA: glycosyltransferase [Stellaceae bacterium]|nr:glycosyltransferase [Stellaceae bacterium]